MPFPHISFTAAVVPGAGKGRELGFPTLNLAQEAVPVSLAPGVYAARVRPENSEEWMPSALFLGERKTIGLPASCEVHLIDHDPSAGAPSKTMEVAIVERIRDVRKFESTGELKEAIANDILHIRQILHP